MEDGSRALLTRDRYLPEVGPETLTGDGQTGLE